MEKVVKLSTRRGNVVYDIREAITDGLTAGELISLLENFPSDAKVVFDNDNGYSFEGITACAINYGLVESYDEEREREEAELEMETIESSINYIARCVNISGGEMLLDNSGIELDTCSDDQDDNLVVYSLTTKPDGKLYGKTNWGLVNLEVTIVYSDDWYALEDIVRDTIVR